MWVYRCTNPDCDQDGVDKTSAAQVTAPMLCGRCHQPVSEQPGGSDE